MLLRAAIRLADAWLARAARPDPAALAAVSGRAPCVVVIGGSEGIGCEIARLFAQRGLHVMIIGRRPQLLETARALIAVTADPAASITTLALDVTAERAMADIETALEARSLYLDVLVVAAAHGLCGSFDGHPPAAIGSLVELNVAVPTRMIRRWLPAMRGRGRGGVLALASLGAYAPGPYQAVYYASKAYVVSLIEAVAEENRGTGVRLAVVAPGPVETAFHAKMSAQSSLYRTLLPAMSPERAAASAVRGYLLGHVVITPGLLTPLLALAMRVIPRVILAPVVGWLLKPRGAPATGRS